MSLKDVELKKEYRSLLDNVVNDFYIPVLRNSVLYQRAVGFSLLRLLLQFLRVLKD